MFRLFPAAIMLTIISILVVQSAAADPTTFTVTLAPIKDNTLYQTNNGDANQRSNGSGAVFFSGRNNNATNNIRRALMAFDLSSIPTTATIINAALQLYMTQTSAGSFNLKLHKLSGDCGEGSSSTTSGMGTTPGTGDATWTYTFYNTQSWTTAGGDFVSTDSAVTSVNGVGLYNWSGAQMVADIQTWSSTPSSNFGWLLQGDETQQSLKQFSTREESSVTSRPQLTVIYSVQVPTVSAKSPDAGEILNVVPSISITFSEAVVSVPPDALTVGGSSATNVSGSGAGPYIFSGFAAPADGTVNIVLTGTNIHDPDGNASPGVSWNVTYDTTAPQISTVSNVLGQNSTIRVTFDGPVNGATTQANYTITEQTAPALGTIASGSNPISVVPASGNSYDLTFNGTLGASGSVRITVSSITDAAGNVVTPNFNSGTVPIELSSISID